MTGPDGTPDRAADGAPQARLRLLATTDLHMHLTSHDYYAHRPDPSVGLTRTATLIAQARAEARDTGALVLLFDNGDALQGAPMGDMARTLKARAHPLMRAYAYLGYDTIGLGNHDFNFGLDALEGALAQAPCPAVCSNLHRIDGAPAPGFLPVAVLDRQIECGGVAHAIKIGVLSFLPPQTVDWDAHLLAGTVRADDIIDSARHWVAQLKQQRCDIIVALAHCGVGNVRAEDGMENALIPLAALDGLDAIVAGHTHRRIPGPDHTSGGSFDAKRGLVHGKPVVMPGAAGAYLGVIDLTLVQEGAGGWSVTNAGAELRPIAGRDDTGRLRAIAQEDPALCDLLAEDHRDTVAMMAQPVGHSGEAMHSYFTFFAPDRSLAVVAAAQAAAVRPHLAGTYAADLPLLSAVAPGKFGARAGPDFFTDVPAGPLAMRHLADLQIFPNDLTAVLVTGAQLIDWLEMSASLFQQIAPGTRGAMLLDPEIPGHEFDVLYGLHYRIDLSREARFFPDGSLRSPLNRRTLSVRWNNAPIDDGQLFVVAVNSFRASGGGHFESLRGVQQIPLPRGTVREALRRYVSGEAAPDPLERAQHPWAFQPMPGTRVRVKTGPGAAKHLNELAERGVEPRGIDKDGFLHLSVPL